MSDNPLTILISAALDKNKAEKSINDSIRALANNPSLQKLELKINVDKSFLTTINAFVDATNKLSSNLQSQNRVVKETVNEIKNLDGSVTKTTQQILASGEMIEKTRTKHDANKKAVQDESKAYETQRKTLVDLKSEMDGYIKSSEKINKNKSGEINSITSTYKNANTGSTISVNTDADGYVRNSAKLVEYLKLKQATNKKLEDLDRDHYNALKTNMAKAEALDKAHYQALKLNGDMATKNALQIQSKLNTAYTAKQSANGATGVADTKALEVLNRQYDKVLVNLNAVKNSGKQLTDSELAGINRRIEALNNLAARQKTQEKEAASLASTQLRAETQVNNLLANRNFSSEDTTKLRGLLTQLQQLTTSSKNYKVVAKELTDQISKMGSEAQRVSTHAQTLGDKFKQTFSNMLMYSGVGSIFYGTINALKSGVQHIVELDAAMTDLRKVTDETDTTYNRFLTTANETANSIGGITVDVIKSTTQWARLGYTIQEAQTLAKQTLVYQNVGDISSAEEASQSLISTIKGFGVEVDAEGKNITKIVDIYNEVGNKFAISSAGIGEALRRSAASMSEAGNTIEESVALATAANSTIQDPARVGQALKTISMRLRGVSEDGEDLSDLIPSLEQKFGALGLTLKKDDSTFKSTYEIFEDLSTVWDKLSDFQQADILESVAGKLQGNIAASLINNFKDAQDSLNTALNSTGSAARENEKYIESIAGRLNLFKNAISEFWEKSIDSSTVKTIIDTLTKIVSAFDNLGTVAAIVTGVFLIFKSKAISDLVTGLFSTIKALFTTTTALEGTAAAAGTASVAMTRFQMALGWIGLATTGLTVLYTVLSNLDSPIEKQTESVEKLSKKYNDLDSSLSEVSSYYKENYESIGENTETKNKLFSLQNELIDTFGLEADGLDLVNGKYEEQNAILDELKKKQLQNEIADTKFAIDAANQTKYSVPSMDRVNSNFFIYDDYGDKTLNAEEYYKELLELQEKIRNKNTDIFNSSRSIPKNAEQWNNALVSVGEKLEEFETLYKLYGHYTDLQKESQKEYALGLVNLNSEQKKFFDDINNIASKQPLEDYGKYVQGLAAYASWFTGGNATNLINSIKDTIQIKADPDAVKSFDNLKQAYEEAAAKAKDTTIQINSLKDAFTVLDKGLSGSSEHMSKFAEYLVESKEEIDLLNKAQKELSDNGYISSATLKDMNEKYSDFIKVTGLSTTEIRKFINAKKDEKIVVVQSEIDKTKTTIDETKKRIQALKDEYDATVALLSAKIANGSMDDIQAEVMLKNSNKSYLDAQKILSGLLEKYGILNNTLNDFKSNADDTSTSNGSLNDSYSDTVEILTELQKKLAANIKSMDDLTNARTKMRKGSQEYRDSITKENKLLQQQIDLRKEGIANPSKLVSSKITTTTKTNSSDSTSTKSSNSSTSTSSQYSDIIQKYAELNNVSADLITAIIKTESNFDTYAKSSAGAQGLMQLMPSTAKSLGVSNSYDAEQNIAAGTKHFARLLKKYNGDVELALYAYNAGEGNVDKWIKSGQIANIPFSETKSYASKVLNNTSSSVSSTSSANGTTTIKNGTTTTKTVNATAKELQDAVDAAITQNTADANTIYQNNLLILDSVKQKYERLIAGEEAKIEVSKKLQDTLDPNSVEWREENNKQINIQSTIQNLLHVQKSNLQKYMDELGVDSEEYDDYLKQLSVDWLDIQSEKITAVTENLNSMISESEKKISDLSYEISLSKGKMDGFTKGTGEYNAELKNQISLTEQQISANQDLITFLEQQLKNEKLTTATKVDLKEQIKELVLANYEYSNSIKDINENLKDLRETAADNIIDELKAVIEKERDLKLDAIEDLMDAEDERHEKRIANIEEEQKQFEDYINAQIDALDKAAAEEDYAKELARKQADRQKIVDQLNTLSLDNSASAKKKKAELTEQLADIDEEIAEYQTDRERTLRKEALQQQLDDRSDYTDELTDAENEYNETVKDSLEAQKDATEQAYEDILDNAEYFYNLKQQLLSDDTTVTKAAIDEIQTKYGTYFTTLQNHAFTTNQAFENLNYTLKQSLANLEKYSNGDYSESSSSTSSSSSGSSSTLDSSTSSNSSTLSAKQIAWQDYLNNKQKAEQLVAEMKKLTPDSADYASKLAQYKVLNAANIAYRKQYTDFLDGSYAQLKDKVMSAETGGLTSSWGSDGKFALLHEKELVLNKSDTSNLLDTVNVVRDIMSNFKSSFNSGTVNTSSTSTASSTVNNNVTIENVTIQANDADTGQSLLDKLSSALNSNLKLRTV